jgi:hypothetical protein
MRGEGAMVTKAREKEPTSRRAAYLTNGERKIAPAPRGTAVGHQAVPPVALPPRYAMIGLGSGLLMLASVASIPLGLAETAAPREVLTLVAGAAGVVLLVRAGLAAPLSQAWYRWLARWCWPLLIVMLTLTVTVQADLCCRRTMDA